MQLLAIVVVGGLTTSTLLTLIVLPSAYITAHDLAAALRRLVIGEAGTGALQPEMESVGRTAAT